MKKKFLSIIPLIALAITIIMAVNASTNPTTDNTISANTSPNTNSSNDWTMVNHDNVMSRNSPQTTINKDNVNQLQVKWIFNTGYPVEASPLIVGDTAYVQNNAMQIFAIDMKTGLNKWKYDPNEKNKKGTTTHGITYENGIIYAPTGNNKTVVALNAADGSLIWQSPKLSSQKNYQSVSPPAIWNDYLIEGSAGGDEPNNLYAARGSVTGINKTNGHIIWHTPTVVGSWLNISTHNGGGTSWTGGSIDTDTGVVYMPTGNVAPNFNAKTRPPYTPYTNSMIAINITNGKILWHTPFINAGTVLNVTLPDTHDFDTNWGSQLVTANINGTTQKVVIGHNKNGDIIAMNAKTGKPLWWINVAYHYRSYAKPSFNGSGGTSPASSNGIEDYSAVDSNTLYVADSNSVMSYYLNKTYPTTGYVVPDFKAMPNGIGNGTIVAIDLNTGKIKWKHDTPAPTWVSPLVTDDIVFSGHVTATGKPYKYNTYGNPTDTPKVSTGILMALNKNTGQTLWEYNVGAPIGVGGPSIGNGMLLVPTGAPDEVPANPGGYIVAFGLPKT